MAASVKKIETIEVDLQARPGALSEVYCAFRDAGVNVVASWAFEMGPGQAKGIFCASDTAKAIDVLTKRGLKPVSGNACWAQGEDAIGVYCELLEKIKNAGVNLHATDAFAVGGKFATVFFADAKDYAALCKALNC